MASADRLSEQQATVLGVLAEAADYAQRVPESGGALTAHLLVYDLSNYVGLGSAYKRLAELVAGGLAEVIGRDGRRRLYRITPAGRDALAAAS